ncbi:MFS transporter [Corynebacterium sp. 20_84]
MEPHAREGIRKGTAEYRRASIALLFAGLAIFNALYTTQALLPTLTDELGMTEGESALTVSATTGGLALCVVPASILSERFGRGRVLIISALLATCLGLCLPLAATGGQLIAMRFIQGCLIAGTPAVAMTWISEEIESDDAAGAMGLYIAGNSIGGLIGRLVPAFILEVASWRWALFGGAVTALLFAVIMCILLPQQRRFEAKALKPGHEISAMLRHLSDWRLVGLYATAFFGMGMFVSVYNMFGFRAIDHFGLPPALAGLVYLMYLSGTWSSARAGVYVKQAGRGRVLVVAAGIMLLGAITLISGNLWFTLAGLLLFTASFFAMHSVASGWVGQVATRDRAEASSTYVFFYYIGSSALGALTGWLFQFTGWSGFIGIVAGFLVALVCIAGWLALTVKKGAESPEHQH